MYTKAFHSMLDSSIWAEPPEVCKVWVTLLLMSDPDGMVEAAAPGIANRAHVTLDVTLRALQSFQEPDPHSRTMDHDGRRIERVDGGYLVLNYVKYREMKDRKTVREQTRERVRAYRERKKRNVTVCNAKKRHEDEDVDEYVNEVIPPIGPPYDEIISDLNTCTGKRYRVVESNKELIRGRFAEGFTLEDFKAVHRKMVCAWKNTADEKYLRPETLYRASKFQGYLNRPEREVRQIGPGHVSDFSREASDEYPI